MEITNETLADLATTRPGATRVFLKHKLDFCCGGRRPLGEACAERGLDTHAILAEIISEDARGGDLSAWAARPLTHLVDFIEEHYHRRLRADLPELIAMATKVERVHAEKPTCPSGLAARLCSMHESVLEHLAKEEQVLFPMVRAGYTAQVGGPVRVMEQEHEEHGRNLAYLRELTGDFTAPAEACATWKALYLRLSRFADELMEHIHLENNILFPRTLCG
jgi:regulator of cell morphogenesis and NO signaling